MVCRATEPEYISQILSICIKFEILLLSPLLIQSFKFLQIRNIFSSHGIHIIVSDSDFVRKCRDKRLTPSLFISFDSTPKILDSSNSFPCFMKPLSGSCSQGIKVIQTADCLSMHDLQPDTFQNLCPVSGLSIR